MSAWKEYTIKTVRVTRTTQIVRVRASGRKSALAYAMASSPKVLPIGHGVVDTIENGAEIISLEGSQP
jgi:hypothetical protein